MKDRSDREDAAATVDAVFRARSVAIVGASQNPSSIGGRPIKYLQQFGYEGALYPVNPKRDTIGGLKVYPSLDAIPDPVDLAIVILPAGAVPDALRDCAAAGIQAVIVFSGGYAEMGGEGEREQETLRNLAGELGLRVIGPNSMGTMNLHNGLMATFSAVLERTHRAGPLSLVSQSGAYGAYIMAQGREMDLGFDLFASTGNEMDVELAELITYMLGSSETRAVLGYVEQIRDGGAFARAARAGLEAGKPIVLIKVGRSSIGARAAQSHTGALAGPYARYKAVFEQYGVIAVDSVDEMMDVSQLIQYGVAPEGRRLGILSISGGAGVLLADAAEETGLEVPQLPEDVQGELRKLVPFAAASNPIDFTPQVLNDASVYRGFLSALAESPEIDVLVIFLAHTIQYEEALGLRLVEETAAAMQATGKSVIVVSTPGDQGPVGRALREARIPYFADPMRAVRALSRVIRYHQRRPALLQRPFEVASPVPATPVEVAGERAAKAFFASHGLPVPREVVAETAVDAVAAARDIGFPVVLKIDSPDVAHKTEVGGVRLDLRDEVSVEDAFREIREAVGAAVPQARINGISVQQMVDGGVPMIVGMKRDPVFGPMILCGLGGIHAEVIRDVAMARAPVDLDGAHEMLASLKGYPLLTGSRGQARTDVDALARIIVRCTDIALDAPWIEEFDINPLIVLEEGRGCVCADALITTVEAEGV